MVRTEETDLEQTVIVVTHPRAKRTGGPHSHVTVLNSEAQVTNSRGETLVPGYVQPGYVHTHAHAPGEPRGRIWVMDQHPHIHAGTSRRELRPGLNWNQHALQQTGEWKCWKILQNWRVFTHAVIRMKFKRRCWHHLGDLLKLWVARREDKRHHLMDEPTYFPNASHVDRQLDPLPATSSDDPLGSRHRILRH